MKPFTQVITFAYNSQMVHSLLHRKQKHINWSIIKTYNMVSSAYIMSILGVLTLVHETISKTLTKFCVLCEYEKELIDYIVESLAISLDEVIIHPPPLGSINTKFMNLSFGNRKALNIWPFISPL